MGEFRYIPADEVAERHRAARPKAPSRQNGVGTKTIERQPEQRNVEQVLALGATRYITYRDRTYRIPPVPFKLGQSVLTVYVRSHEHARHVALTGKRDHADEFYLDLDRLAKLIWSHVRPIGKVKRFFWRCGLLRNPFRSASEGEMRAVVDFFLQGRMTSSVRSISETEARA
jgi:hypothetical protein